MNINYSKFQNTRYLFSLILFLIIALLRSPTLFNDYYDVDELSAIVQTHEFMAGDIPGEDFKESKLPVYHAIFKAAYFISHVNGWVMVHAFTILIIFFTSFFIYLSGKEIKNFETGAIASIFYGIFVSSFNRHFMATNGEIIYNLPIAAGLYFLIILLSRKEYTIWQRFLFLIFSIGCGICAANVKFHGTIFFIFLSIFFIIYLPYFNKISAGYYYLLLLLFSLLIIILLFDYFLFNKFANILISNIKGKIIYAFVKGFNPFFFLVKYIHRQGMLILWHFAVWLPALIFIYNFIKKRFKAASTGLSAAAILFILSYMMIFGGGSRLYFHYFLAVYPGLCIIGAYSLCSSDIKIITIIKKRIKLLILLPAIFFLTWNTKDIIIKHFLPQAFYNEGKILYWTRAVLVGTFNDYLLPEASYKDVCEYIKKITKPGDRIFVWGDGPYLYYFSERRMGTWHLWPKSTIFRITNLYKNSDEESKTMAKQMEKDFIQILQKKKPLLFIDTSANGLSTFYYVLTPLLKEYMNKNYLFLNEIQKMKIYKKTN